MLPIRMTPIRRAWLERLRDEGPAQRASTPTGYQCMHAGWTEWDYRLPDGTPVTAEQALKMFGGGVWWDKVNHNSLERITEAGRLALEARVGQ